MYSRLFSPCSRRLKRCFGFFALLLFSGTFSVSICANEILSLDSFDGTLWQVFPAEGLKWNAVAGDDFEPEDWVPGVVPGTVFVAYVEAGREENPDWGDNVYRVDESFYNQHQIMFLQLRRDAINEPKHCN